MTEIERIDVRTMWPKEANAFTPWLAEKENLDLLGAELGMKLECIKTEYQIGSLRLDILAREADTDKTVAIENQLKETDINHLDKLLTYAKGCNAHVAIWVAPEFRHEYANVLHWLNEWTGEEIKFYGVKVEVIRRSSDARCEPRFRKVVYPGGWNRANRCPSTMRQDEPDFTCRLAENLDLLGAELCMKLQLIEQEHQIGSILAREADTGKTVAIENQFEETDISHLDKLLAYAKGCDARVAIWVAPEFQHEYANVLHWLNELTGKEIEFYGVKVEVIRRSSDARCEPRFRKVVYPGGPRYIQKYCDFFRPLIAELIGTGFADEFNRRYLYSYTGRCFPSYLNGVWYAASLKGKNNAWVILHIDALDSDLTKEKTKEIFDRLQDDQEQIEASIACDPAPEWHWCRHNPYKYSSIKIRRDGSVDDPPRELEETRNWMRDLLPKLKEVFEPRVAKILGK